MVKKLKTLDEVVKSLKDVSADAKIQWSIQYPVVDVTKIPEVKKALWGFEDWSKSKNVEFESTIKRYFKLRGFKFKYIVSVIFKGVLKDVGLVLDNYIETLRSVNIIPSEAEPHQHSVSMKSSCNCSNNCETSWKDCDNCGDCDLKENCPKIKNIQKKS